MYNQLHQIAIDGAIVAKSASGSLHEPDNIGNSTNPPARRCPIVARTVAFGPEAAPKTISPLADRPGSSSVSHRFVTRTWRSGARARRRRATCKESVSPLSLPRRSSRMARPTSASPRRVPPAARLLLALLAAAAPLLAAAQPEAAPAPDQCTPDLIKSIAWGVGTGAHQVEGRGGGRAPSVWEAFVARDAGAIADRSDAARGADFYGRFASDVALLQRLKVGFGGWRVAAGSVCGCTSGCTDTHAPHTTC